MSDSSHNDTDNNPDYCGPNYHDPDYIQDKFLLNYFNKKNAKILLQNFYKDIFIIYYAIHLRQIIIQF